jgi:hypothetical protein
LETNTVSNATPYFQYTQQDADEANSFPVIKEGAFEFGVAEVKAGEHEETRNATLELTLVPLDANGTPDRDVQIRDTMTITLPNPKVTGHKVTSPTDKLSTRDFKRIQNKKAENYVRAIDPGYLPADITWDKNEKCFRDAYGTVMAKDEADAYQDKVIKLVWEKLGEWYTDPSKIKGARFFGTTKKKGLYTNLAKVMANAGDQEIIREEFAV